MSEFEHEDCALPTDKLMASHRPEPLSRSRVEAISQRLEAPGGEPLGPTLWNALREWLDTDAAHRQQIARFKTMSTVEMMCENYNVKVHIEEWEARCLKAEQQLTEAQVRITRLESDLAVKPLMATIRIEGGDEAVSALTRACKIKDGQLAEAQTRITELELKLDAVIDLARVMSPNP